MKTFARRVAFASLIAFGIVGCNQHDAGGAGSTQNGSASAVPMPGEAKQKGCDGLPDGDQLKQLLHDAAGEGEAGGLAGGKFEWAAVVDRQGRLCAVAVSSDDVDAAWPGSQAIAKAKAFTANAFSSDTTPMSTARLYTLTQPGHSLWGAAAANPFNPECLSTAADKKGVGKVCGGSIVFGGGLALYKGQTRIGGLGASGDTACADHEIAKRMRNKLGLNPPEGANADDIVYTTADGPSVYAHPLCINTWRNGKKIGEEPPAAGY